VQSAYQTIRQGGEVVDYKNVKLRGYLSTWQSTTPSDRDGDYVVKGAFTESIPRFMQNPVMLANHDYTIGHIAGAFTLLREDDYGLYVEGQLSDSPVEWQRDIRFKVVRGELCTLSMGGLFTYAPDGRGIVKVSLYEGSLIPVPSNPDARFSVIA
jgi:HK97 family phage prohead protease